MTFIDFFSDMGTARMGFQQAGISDTQIYRAAGDAITVPVVYEIARRMEG